MKDVYWGAGRGDTCNHGLSKRSLRRLNLLTPSELETLVSAISLKVSIERGLGALKGLIVHLEKVT